MNNPVRHNPIISLDDDDDHVGQVHPAPKPMLPKEEADRIAQSFIGKAGQQKPAPIVESAPARKQRRYTTGRNKQVNLKATDETINKLNRLADERGVSLAQVLELALDALEKAT
jgi:hypothetical protein